MRSRTTARNVRRGLAAAALLIAITALVPVAHAYKLPPKGTWAAWDACWDNYESCWQSCRSAYCPGGGILDCWPIQAWCDCVNTCTRDLYNCIGPILGVNARFPVFDYAGCGLNNGVMVFYVDSLPGDPVVHVCWADTSGATQPTAPATVDSVTILAIPLTNWESTLSSGGSVADMEFIRLVDATPDPLPRSGSASAASCLGWTAPLPPSAFALNVPYKLVAFVQDPTYPDSVALAGATIVFATSAPVPTLSEWVYIGLGLLLLAMGVFVVRKRSTAIRPA